MFEQLVPLALQRCQRKAKWIGAVPVQLPGSAWSRLPFWAVPEMVGGEVFEGGEALAGDCGEPEHDHEPERSCGADHGPDERRAVLGSTEHGRASFRMGCPLRSGTRARRRTGAVERPFYGRLTKLLPPGCARVADSPEALAFSPNRDPNRAVRILRAGRPREAES
jgi:hypothetical protein